MDGQIKSTLQKHLKGITNATLDNIMVKLHLIPADRILLVLDLTTSLAAISLRSSVEFLMVVPEIARTIEQSELRAWGEIGKRLASTNPDSAIEFFHSSLPILNSIAKGFLLRCLTLVSRQAALSTSLALDCFKSFPETLAKFDDPTTTARVLNLCYEVSQHSVKHSCDLLSSGPVVINHLQELAKENTRLISQMLDLTTAFVHRSGGTAAEFFTSIPEVLTPHTQSAWSRLFEHTYTFLDKSGGVALQYFRAAGKILFLADAQAFERWTQLSLLVVAQGNATGYHFLKISPKIFTSLARYGDKNRNAYAVNQVLDIVIQISHTSANSAVECFKASPVALRQASLDQFKEWALHGLELYGKDNRRAQAYYGLESNRSRQALYNREGGLSLESISQTLRLYIEALTGKEMLIKPMSETSHEFKIGDGRTILLPSAITEFEDESSNFKLYKALAAHAAGQVEFDTYTNDCTTLQAANLEIKTHFQNYPKKQPSNKVNLSNNFLATLDYFPDTNLARRIFTSLENGRIDRKLRQTYRGLRRDLDFVKERLITTRPDFRELPREIIAFEMLFQEAILGGISEVAKEFYPNLAYEIETTFDAYITLNSKVGDTLMGTLKIYKFLERINEPEQIEKQSEKDADNKSEQDENDAGGQQVESDNQPNQRATAKSLSEPFSYWSPSLEPIVNPADEILTSLNPEADVPEQGLEPGDRAFFYDEWDRDLGDYRTNWCRVIERRNAFGNRSFVDGVRGRFSGVISSVRHQFQLLRPENLRKIMGELDGEDYDLQALIDYAIDRRSSGRVSERIYIRKLRRQRDVMVSFLLDMSSSTARTISRYPNQPYSKPGQRIIDIEKEGLVLMSEALEAVGDNYSIQGFTSEGRRNVKFYIIKDFNELYSEEVAKRIGGITYQNNTRLGAAIRHASARLEKQDARTKLLIILSDGRPYDHDYGDSRYAREDTKIALRQAKINNITPFCITIDRESEEQLRDLYGEVGYTIIDNILSLPERLPGIYRRLTT
ncbi:MAG: VWA domain-containing protein [Acidobacteria bacterium]|nr:VWA domain-containing protein [Acidobacteriota bacterium]